MYDLQPVAVFQWRLRPLLARHNFKVEFDGHAIRLHAQLLDERVESFHWSQRAMLSVNGEVHR